MAELGATSAVVEPPMAAVVTPTAAIGLRLAARTSMKITVMFAAKWTLTMALAAMNN